MPNVSKRLNIFIFCLWISLMAFLLYRNYSGAELQGADALKGLIDKDSYWYDIYSGTKKIGFAIIKREKVGDEIIITDEREIRVQKDGKEDLLTVRLKSVIDSQYAIKSFEYTSHFRDEQGIKANGEVDGKDIIFRLESAEKRRTFKTPIKGNNFYLPSTFIPALVQNKPAPNTSFTISVLDFTMLSLNDMRVVLEEIRPIKSGINILSLYKFRAGNAVWWSNEKGVLIKEESPAGFTLYSQIEVFAKDPSDRILFDHTSLPFLKADKLLGNPEKLALLKIRIKGFRLDPELYTNSTVTLEGDILGIQKENKEALKGKTSKLPYTGDKLDRYLRPDEWVSSDYKPLHDTGIIYAKNNKYDAFLFSEHLTGYLYSLVKTRPMFILQSAENFLKSLTGDYLERSVMFASYTRAAGLPTRLVGGLIYINGYFYFHAWPEVWLDKWVPVDPTFFQMPADVSHIPLKAGTLRDIISVVDDLKSINIEILEAL